MKLVDFMTRAMHPQPNRYLEPVIGPAPELHVAVLVVEGEPGDVDLASGLENAGGDVGAASLVCHHHVGRERPVKLFVRTKKNYIKRCISVFRIFYARLDLPYDISRRQLIN